MMSTIDPLGLPIAVDVVSGEKGDNPLYLPCYQRSKVILNKTGLLYVGDAKMSVRETRGNIHNGDDFYLTPLAMLPKFWQRLDMAEAALRNLTPAPSKGKKQIRDEKKLKNKIEAIEKQYRLYTIIRDDVLLALLNTFAQIFSN